VQSRKDFAKLRRSLDGNGLVPEKNFPERTTGSSFDKKPFVFVASAFCRKPEHKGNGINEN
jgi:hypothetical protein